MYQTLSLCVILSLVVTKVILEQKNHQGLSLNFFQNDYNVTPEHVETVRYNKDYVNRFEFVTFKYNRSTTAFNLTLNFKFDVSKFEVILQAYKFLSNEYREFPIRMQVNFCKAIAANLGGMGKTSCGNFSGCPMLKGRTYRICNWTPDQSKYPPFVPSGRYMMEIQGFYFSTEVSMLRAYAAVTRPEV